MPRAIDRVDSRKPRVVDVNLSDIGMPREVATRSSSRYANAGLAFARASQKRSESVTQTPAPPKSSPIGQRVARNGECAEPV